MSSPPSTSNRSSQCSSSVPIRPEQAYFRPPADRNSPRRVKESTALRFYREVLRLDHLHYGLWDGEDIDLAGLRTAQQRYADRLRGLIPNGVARILDVGAGTGAFSRQLASAGFEVEGLSPDPYQKRLYEENAARPFHLGRFQEFEPSHAYDLVLMSESSQYVWIESICDAVRNCVDDGYWLLADYFVVHQDGSRTARSGHPLEAFLDAARSAGFELEHEEDITAATLPSLHLGQQLVSDYIEPTLAIARDALRQRRSWLYRFGSRLVGQRVRRELGRLHVAVDPEEFERVKVYKIYLFRVPPRS